MPVTLRDVARKAGVSPMTVSRVINDQAGVSADTRVRVEEAIKSLDFSPRKGGGSTTKAISGLIGVVVPDVSNPFFAPIVRGVEQIVRRSNFRTLIFSSESDLSMERDFISELAVLSVKGLVIAPVSDESRDHLLPLVSAKFPMVLIDREIDGLDCDSVTLKNAESSRILTRHLIDVGHKRIAFVSDSLDVSTGRQRVAGFREEMAAAGLPVDDDLVAITSTDMVGGYRAAQLILGNKSRPTAIIAVNNMTALGILDALRGSSIRVPEDMALVSFDDIPHSAVISPFMTVISQPAHAMSTVAAQLLMERMRGEGGRTPRRVWFPGELVVRKSSGATNA